MKKVKNISDIPQGGYCLLIQEQIFDGSIVIVRFETRDSDADTGFCYITDIPYLALKEFVEKEYEVKQEDGVKYVRSEISSHHPEFGEQIDVVYEAMDDYIEYHLENLTGDYIREVLNCQLKTM